MKQQLAVTVAVGLVAGLAGAMLALALRPAAPPASPLDLASGAASGEATAPNPFAPSRSDPAAKTPDGAVGVQGVEARLDRVIALLESMANPQAASGAGQAQRDDRAAADLSNDRAEPGYRRPGALVKWLPPEGVPLLRAWYQREYEKLIAETERKIASPNKHLRGPDRNDAARHVRNWGFDVENLREMSALLAKVRTELDLARWLDETNERKVFPPKAWQLAAFARKRAAESKD